MLLPFINNDFPQFIIMSYLPVNTEKRAILTKYSAIQGNSIRGFADCNISQYWTRKASKVKYSKHPKGKRPRPEGCLEYFTRDAF